LIAKSEGNPEVSHHANCYLAAGDVLSVRDNGLMKDNLRQVAILNEGIGERSLHKLTAVPPNGKLPVINHYPVPKKRSPNPNDPDDYYFPIGWSMFLHDYQEDVPGPNMEYPKGEGDNLRDIEKDWEDGTLDKLKVADSPWNTVFGVSGKGYTGDADTEPDSDQFVGCLEAASSTPYPVKVLPQLLNKRFRNGQEGSTAWSLPAAIGWTTYPGDGYSNSDSVLRNYDDELEDMIDDVSASQDALAGLGGWVLVDEPYSGDVARTTAENPTEVSYDGDGNPDMWYWSHGGTTYNLVTDVTPYAYQQAQDNTNMVRDDLYFRMKYILCELQADWDTSDDHPIHTVIRNWGNYDQEWPDDENKSARVCHVTHDDHYLWYDIYNQGRTEPDTRWKTATKNCVENILKPSEVPKPYELIHYFDGMAHKLGDDKWTADDEEIRYAVYTTLVQGARGVMFWLLSKSEQEAFEQAEKIAEEVETMAPYLLTSHPSVFDSPNEVYLTSTSQSGTTNVDFLVRIHPDDSDKALVIITNDSAEEEFGIYLHFPSSWQIGSVQGIDPNYGWSYVLNDNVLGIGVGKWWGRAFILTKEE